MRDDLRNLRGESEISGSLLVPTCDCRGAWRAIKCAIDLDCRKLAGVIGEKIARPHALWIERALPARCRERQSAEKNLGAGNLEWANDFLRGSRSDGFVQFVQLEECGLAD